MTDSLPPWIENDSVRFNGEVRELIGIREKRPLFRSLPTPPDFPIDALGPLKDAAVGIQQLTQAPIAVAAQSVLAAATLAVQAQRDVELPQSGRKPLTGIFISIADSGERKSSVDRLALAGVYQTENEWREEYDRNLSAYINAKDDWDFKRDQAKKNHKNKSSSYRLALEDIGEAPNPPLQPMLLVSDATPEALVMQLAEGRPFAGLFTAEGGILIGGAAFNVDSKMRTAALLNMLWGGETIRRKRMGTGVTFLPGRRCSAHIMLQPVIADELFGKNLFEGIGLTARMLIVAPESTAGTRLFREAPHSATESLNQYNYRIRFLLKRPTNMQSEIPEALDPPVLQLHPEAAAEWIAFHDICEIRVLPDGYLARIKAFAGKLPEHAGRLAAILTIYDNPDAMFVSLEFMRHGITLAKHYAEQLIRIADGASIPQDLRSAQRLLSWWQGQPEANIHLAKIYQLGPSDVRNARAARAAAGVLEEHGWIERLPLGEVIDGAARREAWRLV